MKLLFDENLSPDLPHLLADLFPESAHVMSLDLDATSDNAIWRYARAHAFTIVTKDKDFPDLSDRLGQPPKVIRIMSGNGPTAMVAAALRDNYQEISAFADDPSRGLLRL